MTSPLDVPRSSHVVSVVIPSRSGGANLVRCQDMLARQTRCPDEVVVVLDERGRGAAWARNEGIRRATGDLIAFLDDDCLPPEQWLETMIDAVDRNGADGAGGTYEEMDPFLSDWRTRQGFPDVEQPDETGLVGCGGNMIFRREWLDFCEREYGYVFNEAFRISQDWEFTWRSRARGATLIYVPVRVKHRNFVTPTSYLSRQFGRGIGISMLFRAYRTEGANTGIHKSLVWGQKSAGGARWLKAFWFKAVGPFDVKSFSRFSYFVLFWLGEKFQSLGFFWGLVRKRHFVLRKPS